MGHTVLRYTNAIHSGYSFIQSTLTGIPYTGGMPLALGIELTNTCNLACPECNSGSGMMTRPKGFIDPGLFSRIIDELKPYLFNLNLYFQGEPMLHPKFFFFIRKAAGVHTTVSTNGHFIDADSADKLLHSGLGKLIISLDGMTHETYSRYRVGGNFDKVISGIECLSRARRRIKSGLKVEVQYLVNRYNEDQIGEARKFCSDNDIRLVLKSMQAINPANHADSIPADNSFSRYKKQSGRFSIKSNFPNHCARLWFNPVVTWDGKVLPCCFDKDADHIMGDPREDKFRDIWQGPRFRLFRRNVLMNRSSVEICRNCTSGMIGVSI